MPRSLLNAEAGFRARAERARARFARDIREMNLSTCMLAFCMLVLPVLSHSQPDRSDSTAMHSANLPPCPDSPNCVSSQAPVGKHYVDPLVYTGSGQRAFAKLKEVIVNFEGTRIIRASDTYLHAEFKTRWLKFVDDVEAVLDDERSLIHIRSASRVGYWDLGTNRRRVESIRALMQRRVE